MPEATFFGTRRKKGYPMLSSDLQATLDRHYRAVEKTILARQDPVSGLLPASTAVNAHGDYTDAWVRDNVYSILCVWGLFLAYRKHNPDHHRSYLLGQTVVKLMRGLLSAMMRQSDRVEAFKHSLNPVDALHAKYGTSSGLAVVGDTEWGHLQLDATSLYLLMLAQMTASGLRMIFTLDEVNFVQNLVHYISRTYCTADYGIWERGNKINHGTTEINCSSVGMAKAALEALDGFNLFGNVAGQEAIIHVLPSDVARSRFTLHGLLPRESTSKETDAALLSIIGYPAYAVEDAALVERTRNKIIRKLGGRYGCKRFLLDGHQSSIEDTSRLHYEPSELRAFKDIESEWPLFFTYFLLDALMRSDTDAVKLWREKLEPLFIEQEGERLLPELYIVPKEKIEAEKANPGSQERVPNENLPLVWAQSLFILSDMIQDGVLRPSDIDPLRRRARIGHTRTTHSLVAILAENGTVRQRLLDLGIYSETLDEVKPVRVLQATELSRVHAILGKNGKLELSGRPLTVTRTITTARMHLLNGVATVFLPYYFNPLGFYFNYDNKLLAQHFRSSLRFLSTHWDQPGQPILPFLVRDDMLKDEQTNAVVELLNQLQAGTCDNITVQTGPLGQLLTTAAVERIDELHGLAFNDLELSDQSPAPGQFAAVGPIEIAQLRRLDPLPDETLIDTMLGDGECRIRAHALGLLWQRKGAKFRVETASGTVSLTHFAELLYESATRRHDWASVRRIADLTGKYEDRLEDALLDIVIQQQRLTVGRAYSEKATFSKPHDSQAILKIIRNSCSNNPAESVLIQEIILHLGHLMRNEAKLFEGMLTIRTWHFVQLLVGQIARAHSLPTGDAYERLLELPPHEIYDQLKSILESFDREASQLHDLENLRASGVNSPEAIKSAPLESELSGVVDWAQWRQQAGMIGRLSSQFYKSTWYLLQQCKGLVIGDKYSMQSRMGTELTLDATAGERSFELRIDTLIQSIEAPDYRQLNIEVIESLARLFELNPQLRIDNDLVLDVLIGHAVRISWKQHHPEGNYDDERARAWEAIYTRSPQETDKAFVDAFIHLLSISHH